MNIKQLFRLKEWVVSKLFFNLAIALYTTICVGYFSIISIHVFLLIALYIISVGSFGYFCNDLFDRDLSSDGSLHHQQIRFTNIFSAVVLTSLIAIAVVPFTLLLPNPKLYLILLIIHLLLLFSYPIPVLIIKSTVLGLIWDALYSYVLPAAISISICASYLDMAFQVNTILVLLVTAWLLSAGLRSILNHQLLDFENDIRSETVTFTLRHGKKLSGNMMLAIFITEWVLFAALTFVLIPSLWIPLCAAIIMFAMVELVFRFSEFRKLTKTETAIALTNQLYDYYLFTGFFVYAAIYWYVAAALFPVVFIMIRLNAFSWLYHRIVLWFIYKLKGGFRRVKKWF
ncbi:MAG TPA: hypothetical protein PLQ09_07465 [Prolixibacteraceae bacterium]|nr:hypothetical protein [Prolixibacteraceae bacterium]